MIQGIDPQTLHHTYILSGDRSAVLADLKTFVRDTLGVRTENNPDFWLKEYESFPVEEARRVQQLQSNTTLESLQVFIISAGEITRSAQQSLLKVTEEPAPKTCFFFVVPGVDMLLPTLLSRAVVIACGQGGAASQVSASDFLSASPAERLELVKVFDPKSGVHKEQVLRFLTDVEQEIARHGVNAGLHDVYDVARKVRATGVSTKALLEHLSMVVPFQK